MVPIFLIVLVDLLALSVILPLLPFYAESLGASPWVVGLLLSTFAFCQLVAGPPLGQYSDRVGRKRVLLLSQVGTFAGFVLLGFARTLWLVFLSRIIDGLTAGNLTVAQAYISDVTAPEDRARAFGIVGMAFGIGFLLGPALSGYLVQFGPSYPIFAAAGFSAASIVATAVLLPPSPAVQAEGHQWDWRAYTGPLRDRMVASRFFQFFLSQFAISTFFSGFALFAERRFTHGGLAFGTREVGYTFAYLGLVGIVFQGALGPLVKRAGESRLVQSGFGLAACSFALLVRAQGLVGVATAMTLFAVGTAVLRPNLTGLISQRTARHQQGVMLGLMQSLQSLAQIVAPMAGGALIEGRWLREWAVVGGVACVVGFFAAAGRR